MTEHAHRVACEVCDEPILFETEEERQKKMKGWASHQYHHPTIGTLNILTCDFCKGAGDQAILAGHTKRIRSGRDVRFH